MLYFLETSKQNFALYKNVSLDPKTQWVFLSSIDSNSEITIVNGYWGLQAQNDPKRSLKIFFEARVVLY